MKQVVHAQGERKVRFAESRLAGLGRLGHLFFVEPLLQRRRKLLAQPILLNNPFRVRRRRGIRQGRPRSQRRLLAHGHIAYAQRDLRRPGGGRRQPSALHRRQMLPHRIDFIDARPARH